MKEAMAHMRDKLTAFGLNPRQWRIHLLNPSMAEIQHHADPDMKMRGRFQGEDWMDLEWIF